MRFTSSKRHVPRRKNVRAVPRSKAQNRGYMPHEAAQAARLLGEVEQAIGELGVIVAAIRLLLIPEAEIPPEAPKLLA